MKDLHLKIFFSINPLDSKVYIYFFIANFKVFSSSFENLLNKYSIRSSFRHLFAKGGEGLKFDEKR